ncbi:hypothetical protein GCM10011369_15650 [Neiella marina]|uniref:Uncharacterized protein n=1 Tax=Neiella marina TaxID=508461 RepID=A0A8J2XP82_9GAMM|nr:protein YgfX [Neiella marina]GGA74699.1 hypothetical protein GCM10011369_15650 [Neiella marina]
MSITTVVCSTDFTRSKLAHYILYLGALVALSSLLLITYYGAFSQTIAATLLMPLVVWVTYLLNDKIASYHGKLILLDSSQLSIQHGDQQLQGALCLPIVTTDIAILMRFESELGIRWCLIMKDAVAPTDFRLLSAMLYQLKRPLQ